MNIGDKYQDNCIFRGIKFSNNVPLLAEDLMEQEDMLHNKMSKLISSVIDSGIINKSNILIKDELIFLENPVYINILGDIVAIYNTSKETSNYINSFGLAGLHSDIVIIGWYQHVNYDTKIMEYGGFINKEIPNNLYYEPLELVPTTRYQFVWYPVPAAMISGLNEYITNKEEIPVGREFDIKDNNSDFDTSVIIKGRNGSIYIAENKSPGIRNNKYSDAVDDTFYIIPIIHSKENSYQLYPEQLPKSSSPIIKSEEEPDNDRVSEGYIWYNPETSEFKTYIEGEGFVAAASQFGLIQYQIVDVAYEEITPTQDINITLQSPYILEDRDIIRITYEGIELYEGKDYTLNRSNKLLTLLNFSRNVGERLVLDIIKIIETSKVSNLDDIILQHVVTVSSSAARGHVLLSDATDSTASSKDGVAATPRAVADSKLIKDESNNKKYKFGVENGILYLEEV